MKRGHNVVKLVFLKCKWEQGPLIVIIMVCARIQLRLLQFRLSSITTDIGLNLC